MDTTQIAAQDYNSLRPASEFRGQDGGGNAVITACAICVLFVLTFWSAPALPQVGEIAANAPDDSAVRFLNAGRQHVYPREIEEEQPEGPLAGDRRTIVVRA